MKESLNDCALDAAKKAYADWAIKERVPYGKNLDCDLSLPIAIKAYLAALPSDKWETEDGRPIFGNGSPHDIEKHINDVVSSEIPVLDENQIHSIMWQFCKHEYSEISGNWNWGGICRSLIGVIRPYLREPHPFIEWGKKRGFRPCDIMPIDADAMEQEWDSALEREQGNISEIASEDGPFSPSLLDDFAGCPIDEIDTKMNYQLTGTHLKQFFQSYRMLYRIWERKREIRGEDLREHWIMAEVPMPIISEIEGTVTETSGD